MATTRVRGIAALCGGPNFDVGEVEVLRVDPDLSYEVPKVLAVRVQPRAESAYTLPIGLPGYRLALIPPGSQVLGADGGPAYDVGLSDLTRINVIVDERKAS